MDGPIDGFARRFWEKVKIDSNHLLDDALSGTDVITEVIYSDRYVCSPLVVNLLISVIHELGTLTNGDFSIRIQGREYRKVDSRSPWQCWHDWHSSQERDEAIRQALEYCGLDGQVDSLPSLPHYRQLQVKLSSGNQLVIQFDQGLSYWETERGQRPYHLKFNFDANNLGEEIMHRIQCRVVAANDDSTQIFISHLA